MLRVNLDETAVCIFQGGNRGTIFAANTRLRALVEAASTAQRRRYITHVGMSLRARQVVARRRS